MLNVSHIFEHIRALQALGLLKQVSRTTNKKAFSFEREGLTLVVEGNGLLILKPAPQSSS
jgi:hypothetical protein